MRVSATQIELGKTCLRKWGWRYLAGKKTESVAFYIGIKVHDLLDRYFKGGAPPDQQEIYEFSCKGKKHKATVGRTASSMINNTVMAFRDVGARVEETLLLDLPLTGVQCIAKMDLLHYDADAQTVYVVDHKTSTDPEKWGKKDEDLLGDVQAVLYAYCTFKTFRKAQKCQLIWNYGSVKGIQKAAYIAKNILSRDEALDKFEDLILPYVVKIKAARESTNDPLDLPYETGSCYQFGGCPFVNDCQLTSKERLRGLFMGNSFLEKLKQQNAERQKLEQCSAEIEATQPPPAEGDQINPPESKAALLEKKITEVKEANKNKEVEALKVTGAKACCGGMSDAELNKLADKIVRRIGALLGGK